MKNKKFVATAVSAALVASVVAPVVADAATGKATTKTNIVDVKLYSATKAKVYYKSTSGKTASKNVDLSANPVKHLATYALVPWGGKTVKWNFTNRVQLPQQKSFAKYLGKAQQEAAAGNNEAAKASLALAKSHFANMSSRDYSASTLASYKEKLAALEAQVSSLAAAVKAINNTTVEVTFEKAISNVAAADFVIDGLTISNAVVKQSTDSKTAVLTTSAQTGGTDYTVKYKNDTVGSFKGISSVIPTSIKFEKTAINAVVGTEVSVKADIGVKEAGVPVTFYIPKTDHEEQKVAEVLTDANGIATFTHTQYRTGISTEIYAYPTGAPAVRDLATVYWGVNDFFKVEEVTKGETIDNNAAKTYKVTYLDSKTGKAVANKTLNITFQENIDTPVDKRSTATVNGINPVQYGDTNRVAQVTTNSNGEAVFTVTGRNTTATPVIFVDIQSTTSNNYTNQKLDAGEERVVAPKVTFAAAQASHTVTVKRDGGEEAAASSGALKDAGRKYTVSVKTKDGKAASNEIITVSLDEEIDNVLSTNTQATIHDYENNADIDKKFKGEFLAPTSTTGSGKKIAKIKLDANGEAEFNVASTLNTDYATPIVWLDIDPTNEKLDQGEASAKGEKVYFAPSKLTSGKLKVTDSTGKEKTSFRGNETAIFKFDAANQSGQVVSGVTLSSTYTVTNTGANAVDVIDGANNKTTVQPNRSITVTGAQITVQSNGGASSSVSVVAYGEAIDPANNRRVYLGQQTVTASFTSTSDVSNFHSGQISGIDRLDERIQFAGTTQKISYKNATFMYQGSIITKTYFESLLASNQYNATYQKAADGKETISLINVAQAGATPAISSTNTLAVTGLPTSYPVDTAKTFDPFAGVTVTSNGATVQNPSTSGVTATVTNAAGTAVANADVLKTAGTYTVTYTYNGASTRVQITVVAALGATELQGRAEALGTGQRIVIPLPTGTTAESVTNVTGIAATDVWRVVGTELIIADQDKSINTATAQIKVTIAGTEYSVRF